MNKDINFRPDAAIFDMDGLMLDTERPAIPLWIKAGEKYGWNIDPQTVFRTIGRDGPAIRAIISSEFGPDFPYEMILDELRRLYNEEFERNIAHKPGLISLLDHLSSLKIPLAVATSSKRNSALWKLRLAGIVDRFQALACGDEVSNGKPAPDIFLLAAERLGILPSACIGFEDSPAGLQGLSAAGIRSVFIKDMIEPPEDILSTVWRRLNDLAEARELFKAAN
jgi:HAD superfamily hydrolase (TIGR01509 family)